MEASLPLLVLDWTTDDGTPGDRYDPELERLFGEATTGLHLDPVLIRKFLDALGRHRSRSRGAGSGRGPRRASTPRCLQFRAFSGDRERTEGMVEDIDGLWFGDDDAIAMTSQDIIVLHLLGRDKGSPDSGDHHDDRGSPRHPHDLLLDNAAASPRWASSR